MRKLAGLIPSLPLPQLRAFSVAAILVALAFGSAPAIKGVHAAPSAVPVPVDPTSGYITQILGGGRVVLTRPALSNPTQLEDVVVQLPVGQTVRIYDIISITGSYDTDPEPNLYIAATV